MKSINIHNYKEYAVDYMAGNLSEGQTDAFIEFIADNPKIADEILLFEQEIPDLPKEAPSFSGLKIDLKEIEINDSNFEEYCIADLEGDLDADTADRLSGFIANDAYRIKTRENYAKTILQDVVVEYPNKESLLKKGRKILFTPSAKKIMMTFAAASIAAIMVLFLQPKDNTIIINDNNVISFTTVDTSEIVSKMKSTKQDTKQTENELIASAVKIKSFSDTSKIIKKIQQSLDTVYIEEGLSNAIAYSIKSYQLSKLEGRSHNIETSKINIGNIDLAISSPETIREIKAIDNGSLRDKAANYLLTKVVTKGVDNINKLAETELDYNVIEDVTGKPTRVILKSRFGEIDKTLAQK